MRKNRSSSKIRYVSHGVAAAVAVWGVATLQAADNTTSGSTVDNTVRSSTATSAQLNHHDLSFVKDAARDGEAEVQLGKLAETKAQSAEIKQLGQRLQQDHSKANQDLMQLAQLKGVTLPLEPPRKEERTADRLENKSGSDFDKAFAEHVIKDHEKDIQKFQKAEQSAKDPDVRAFIQKNLPVLSQHLEMARTAGSAVGVDQRVLSSADKFLSKHPEAQGTAPASQIGEGSKTGTPTGQGSSEPVDQNRIK